MTVIFPGGDFLEFIKHCNKNKFLAGNIPVIKSSLLFLRRRRGEKGGGSGEEEGRQPTAVHLPCARSHSHADQCFIVRHSTPYPPQHSQHAFVTSVCTCAQQLT